MKGTNILAKLRHREEGQGFNGGTSALRAREFHENLCPSVTVNEVAIPGGLWIRKFTLDGDHLLAFSRNCHAISLYEFAPVTSLNSRAAAAARIPPTAAPPL